MCENCEKMRKKIKRLKGLVINKPSFKHSCPHDAGLKNRENCMADDSINCVDCWKQAVEKF